MHTENVARGEMRFSKSLGGKSSPRGGRMTPSPSLPLKCSHDAVSLCCALCFELITHKKKLYRCEFGMVKIYGEDDLELYEGSFNLKLNSGQLEVITIDFI